MNQARSINQNPLPDALPNFRNLGVTLRILLICNGLALLQSVLLSNAWSEVPQHMMEIATLLAPVLLASLLVLWITQPWLARLPYWQGALAIGALTVALTLATFWLLDELYRQPSHGDAGFSTIRHTLLGLSASAVLLMYFRWRSQVLSRALHDARLQVLRARIRPHFLFNTINAVLSVVRTQPRQAETALEDMSDLFRMAMGDEHDLVPLSQEIQLSRQYLALEQLRIGERLQADWRTNDSADDAMIPPLLLQPLLENAVYHGIESLPGGGTITVTLKRNGEMLRLTVENPCARRETATHSGHRMALQNIRERLALLFDVEASYRVERGDDHYRVEIEMPYIREKNLGSR